MRARGLRKVEAMTGSFMSFNNEFEYEMNYHLDV